MSETMPEIDTAATLISLIARLDEQGGRLSIMAEPKGKVHEVHGQPLDRWTLGAEWGEEEPGSEMYAGAAYGMGETLEVALAMLMQDLGQ